MAWKEIGGKLHRVFAFPDFSTALAFVNEIGALAQEANHHPDIALSWGKVEVSLTTHDAGGVTAKDRDLAARIDALYPK